jgi:hypothetical protein
MKEKNICLRPGNEPARTNMKSGRLVVFIHHDSAEVWGLRYGLTLAISTLKIMASTGVFVRVVCALKHSISCYPDVGE